MANRRGVARGLRVLRRSAALAMGLVALWLTGLTADLPTMGEAAALLGGRADFVVGTLSSQMGHIPPKTGLTAELDVWGRFLLRQSALLSSGQEAVEEYLSAPQQPEPVQPTDPPLDVGDGDEGEELPLEPLPSGPVVEHTAIGSDDGSYLKGQEVYLKNETGQSVDVSALAAQPVELELGEGPQILIYHTHGSEAYTQTEDSRYVESDAYRTTDCTRNVVQVGEEMAQVFRSMGFEVIHDTTLYDYPVYSGAYERSRAGVEKWLAQYPTIQFILDVHRDALVAQDGSAYKLVAQEGEEKVAQVMLVVGSADSGAAHPNWRKNLTLAVRVQLALTGKYDQLARPMVLRSTRFNQDLSTGALLVEVGGHGNTLEEALAGGNMFARTTGELLKTLSVP